MNEELKPTNEEIAEYILWFLDNYRDFLIIQDEKFTIRRSQVLEMAYQLRDENFSELRKMFAPVMYNSIEEWSKAQQDLWNKEN